MTYYLDSNIIIFALKNKVPGLKEKIRSFSRSKIKVPSMTAAELIAGAYKSKKVEENLHVAFCFMEPYETVPFDADASEIYGKIKSEMEAGGNTIGPNDMVIAATVMSRGGILITNNVKEFEHVKGLQIEDWTQ